MSNFANDIGNIVKALPPQTFETADQLTSDLYDLGRRLCEDPAPVTEAMLDMLAAVALWVEPGTEASRKYEIPGDVVRRAPSLILHSIAQAKPGQSAAAIARLEDIALKGELFQVRYNSLQSIMNLGEDGGPQKSEAVAALERQATSNADATMRMVACSFLDIVAGKHPDVKPKAVAAWVAATEDANEKARSLAVRALKQYVSRNALAPEAGDMLLAAFEKAASKQGPSDIQAEAKAGIAILRQKTAAPSV